MKELANKMTQFIRSLPRGTVWIEELERSLNGEPVTYEQFAAAVRMLEHSGLLTEVKSSGRRMRPPVLAERYRIHKAVIQAEFRQRVHQLRLELHPLISLDRYFSQGEGLLEQDMPYLQKINRYLQNHGLPDEFAYVAERSFALVGDEKWITEKKGKAVLERIGLWDKLRIETGYDPLMLAVNPQRLASDSPLEPCCHLIVENKATFLALVPVLFETSFHTLIYGCGNKIVGNIEMFPLQYPIFDREHRFYYFGDLDDKGIQIWHQLCLKRPMQPALPFYTACLRKLPAKGKTNQAKDPESLKKFSLHLSAEEGARLADNLANGCYYPQETLSAQELRDIWRSARWN